MGRVGIFLRVAIGVVHPVHDRVGPRIQERRALRTIGEDIEELLPELAHGEHLVSSIPMQEERLTKEGEEPVTKEEQCNCHDRCLFENSCESNSLEGLSNPPILVDQPTSNSESAKTAVRFAERSAVQI